MHCGHIEILCRIYYQNQNQIQYNHFMIVYNHFVLAQYRSHAFYEHPSYMSKEEKKQIIWIQGITVVSKSFWFILSKAWYSSLGQWNRLCSKHTG